MGVLIAYPSIKGAVALCHSEIRCFGLNVVNGIPIRHFFRVRRSDNSNFKGNVTLGATAFNDDGLCVSIVIFRWRPVVPNYYQFVIVERFKICSR